jgi:TonB-dependent receptor
LIAQEVNKAVSERNNEPTEIIEVSGVRASLENALNVKREASSIVDAISANDIDALPALDFGEALQALPGVQLNRADEGRQSTISLRGLSGGFVKTTAFGQSIATPSRSASNVGSSNPFSAFEAGVFDGVTVVKSPTADLQVGGIAGIVDKKLQQALSKKDGTFAVSLGGRYEELTKEVDPEIKLSGVKHIIKDKLAVAFKFGASGQTFRRDTINFTNYAKLGEHRVGGGRTHVNSDTIDAYRERWGLTNGEEIRAANSIRNVTEFSDGDRFSFSGNIEWKPIEDLKIGAHVLLTKRDLASGTKQDAQFSGGFNQAREVGSSLFYKIEPDIDSEPFAYDTDEDGNLVYAVSRSTITDGGFTFTNRETTFLEESNVFMLYADYASGDWVLDGVVTHSNAENNFAQIGLDFRLTSPNNTGFRPTGGARVNSVGTDVDFVLDTAFGDISQAGITFIPDENGNFGHSTIDFNADWNQTLNTQDQSVTSASEANGGRRLQHFVAGRNDNPERDFSSVEFNAQRYTDFGFGDIIRFDSVKFGGRATVENLENNDANFGIAGVDVSAINNDTVQQGEQFLVSSGQTSFFNGEAPNTFGAEAWFTINNLQHISNLIGDGLTPIEGAVPSEPFGFYTRTVGGVDQRFATNFDVEQTTFATYVMTDFSGDLGNVPYTANIGARYVYTENDIDGFGRDGEQPGNPVVPVNQKTDYDHLLPSFNISFELHEDVILRGAYYQAVVNPNLRVQTPASDVRINAGRDQITFNRAKATLEPYTADNFDLSVEWYNREGSAISLGVFQKELTGFFIQDSNICPVGFSDVEDALGAAVEQLDSGECQLTRQIVDDNGELTNPSVRLNQTINGDGEIRIRGLELAIQQKLDFLPYPWNGFGGVFNYTYLDQETTGIAANDENARLFRVSPESFNIIGYWENDGISFRLAYNWRDDSVLRGQNSFLGTLPRILQANGRLDFSARYKINKKMSVSFKGFNLTDEKRVESWGFDDRAISRIDYTGVVYQASVNYRF